MRDSSTESKDPPHRGSGPTSLKVGPPTSRCEINRIPIAVLLLHLRVEAKQHQPVLDACEVDTEGSAVPVDLQLLDAIAKILVVAWQGSALSESTHHLGESGGFVSGELQLGDLLEELLGALPTERLMILSRHGATHL